MADELWYLKLPHAKIVDLIWIIEGYEGLAVPRVLDKERGIVELLVAPDMEQELKQVIEDFSRRVPLERIPRPEGVESIADE